MLRFENFVKRYGTYPSLKIADLNIAPGIYWVKGANGSGKSTLLKSIGGILNFEGNILLGDISVKKQPVAYRKLVNIAEAEPLFPQFLTGQELADLFLKAKSSTKAQVQQYIDSMGMQGYIQNPVGTYSSGMLKKLSLVLAFTGNPKLILLDEPLITIDDAALKILYQWIAAAWQQNQTSFLLSSHQPLDPEALPSAIELRVQDQTLNYV